MAPVCPWEPWEHQNPEGPSWPARKFWEMLLLPKELQESGERPAAVSFGPGPMPLNPAPVPAHTWSLHPSLRRPWCEHVISHQRTCSFGPPCARSF